MKHVVFSFFFSLLLSAIACNENQPSKIATTDEAQKEYWLFPEDAGLRAGDVSVIDSFAFHNTTKFQLERKLSRAEVVEISRQSFMYKIDPMNDCIVVINDFLTQENAFEKLENQMSFVSSKCKDKLIPLPNFWDIKTPSSKSKSHLDPSSEIYISFVELGLKSSKIKSEMSSMPENLKHGVVGGVVLNRMSNTAIYFIQYW